MNTKAILIAALAVLACQPTTTFARDIPPEFLGRGCRFFANENGQGSSGKMDVNHNSGDGSRFEIIAETMGGFWNDNISAVQCDNHCSTILYQDWHRTGAELETIDGQSGFFSLGGRKSNNLASSAAVFCAR